MFFQKSWLFLLHTTHFDDSIVPLFLVFNTFGSRFFASFLNFKQYVNMFSNGLCLIYKRFRINLVLTSSLLDFCFKNLDFSDTQLAHFDACLITLFVIITFFEPILSVCFYNVSNKSSWFYNDRNIFSTAYFKHFDFIEWRFQDSLDHLLMWLYILPISTYTSKSFSSGLILVNLQSRCSFIAFFLLISLHLFLSLCPFLSPSIANSVT